ncbi:MAG: zinc-dependent metalloprotease, partial [Nocardia sp.]|nr:zinc-dependent metalloprotease [Nocardia sp.]
SVIGGGAGAFDDPLAQLAATEAAEREAAAGGRDRGTEDSDEPAPDTDPEDPESGKK